VPFATFLGADVEVDQLCAGAYGNLGYWRSASFTAFIVKDQAVVAMRAEQVADYFVFRQEYR
jgi:hypothetical protein